MKSIKRIGKELKRSEQRHLTGGIGKRCFWLCRTEYGFFTIPVGNTCNIQWLIDPCLQGGGVTAGCNCLSTSA